MTLRKIHFVLI